MRTIYIRGGKPSNTAVKVLTQLLTEKGHKIVRKSVEPHDVTLCWGMSQHMGGPTLNGNVNSYDKFTCFEAFDELGVPHPSVFQKWNGRGMPLPLLARKRHHVKGKDIVVCKTFGDVDNVQRAREHDFFSVFIPTQTEYRVWVFQDEVLAMYEKVYKGEGEYEGYMRNHRFGFKFEKRDDLRENRNLGLPSINAVKALNMDFGAVDVIFGKDGKFYVLEVNSMPSIDSPKRSSGIRLAHHISRWAEAL